MPRYVIRDPNTIKQVVVKDFEFFEDHLEFTDENMDKLWGNSLFFLKGEKWRQMRATLSPAFTGSKMRQMFELVIECATDAVNHLQSQSGNGKRINIEMGDFFSRYTNDVIASCAFGLKTNSFADPENEFYVNGRSITTSGGIKTMLRMLILNKIPQLAKLLKISVTDSPEASWFRHTILDTMDERKKNNIFRPDMINIMMQIRNGTLKYQSDEEKFKENDVDESKIGNTTFNYEWNDDEIVSQCFIFFIAGFDTSSLALAYASYELVANPFIQQKLFEEIIETEESLKGKPLTYDALQKMKYMDQVICETLRKWPPGVQADRVCVKDYVYNGGRNLKFKIEKGKSVIIPIYGIHHDPKYFPEPERFDPERFSDANKHQIIAGTFIPFGVGQRNCIGSRFALMKLKAILYYLLLNFSFEANENTQIPIKLKKIAFSYVAENGIQLELKPRRK
ncbi:hypothetical protein HA402_009700 [Bradysia odoriphaga]|nr:hypothetical protein HA402_009700 [Bradysia odoriphaga]